MSNLVTPIGRLCFPALFEARAAVAKATPKFSATILLDKQGEGVAEFMRKVRMTIQKVIGLRWPDPKSRPEQLKLGVKDGDTLRFTTGVHAGKLKKEKYPEYGGCWAIQASRETAKGAPGVVDTAGNPVTSGRVAYPGVNCRISFDVFAYNKVNVGVACGLGNVLIVGGGEPFGEGTAPVDVQPEDDFSDFIKAAAQSDAFAEVDTTPNEAASFDDISF